MFTLACHLLYYSRKRNTFFVFPNNNETNGISEINSIIVLFVKILNQDIYANIQSTFAKHIYSTAIQYKSLINSQYQ